MCVQYIYIHKHTLYNILLYIDICIYRDRERERERCPSRRETTTGSPVNCFGVILPVSMRVSGGGGVWRNGQTHTI